MNNTDLCELVRAADSILFDFAGESVEGTADILALADAYEEDERCIDNLVKKIDYLEQVVNLYRRSVRRYIDTRVTQVNPQPAEREFYG